MGSCRISGFVFGPVLRHYPTEPVPLGSGLRDLSPRLLRHVPYHCTSHRVWHDPQCIELTLRPVLNEGHAPIMQNDTLEQAADE